MRWQGGDTEYLQADLPIMLVLGDYQVLTLSLRRRRREAALLFPESWWHLTMWGPRPCHFIITPNTKRHPNNTKTDQFPIYEVITGLPRPYHNTTIKLAKYQQPYLRFNSQTPYCKWNTWYFEYSTSALNECVSCTGITQLAKPVSYTHLTLPTILRV